METNNNNPNNSIEEMLVKQINLNQSLELHIASLNEKIKILENISKMKTEIINNYKNIVSSLNGG